MLEASIDRLAAALEKLADAVATRSGTATAPAPAQSPAKPAAAKPAAAKPAAPAAAPATTVGQAAGAPLSGPTVEQLRDQLRALLDSKGKDAVVAALAAVGAAKLSDVKQADYTRLAEAITGQAAAQADPFA